MSTINKQLTNSGWLAVAEGVAEGDTVTIAGAGRQPLYYCTTDDGSDPVIKYSFDLNPGVAQSMALAVGEKLFCKGNVVLVMDATNPLVTTDVFA